MNDSRINSTIEDCQQAETLNEVIAMFAQWVEDKTGCEDDPKCLAALGEAFDRVMALPRAVYAAQDGHCVESPTYVAAAAAVAAAPKPPVQRASKNYRLLDVDVRWTTKPQVHAIMCILGAHAKPGDVLQESDIVKMMVANEHVLNTRQGGKRIWDYYKGNHAEGLLMHGNVEVV